MTLVHLSASTEELGAGGNDAGRRKKTRDGARKSVARKARRKARPIDRYRECFEQAMADLEDFEIRLAALETGLIIVATKAGLPF